MISSNLDFQESFELGNITSGSILGNGQYQLCKKVGEGSYGQVWAATDLLYGGIVALKVPKSSDRDICLSYKLEYCTLACIMEEDLKGAKNCVRIVDSFTVKNGSNEYYPIIVTEMLGLSLKRLSDFQTQACAEGVPCNVVKNWTKQILSGLNFLHNDLGIIHMDLKPDNILLKQPCPKRMGSGYLNAAYQSEVKIVDFGNVSKPGQFESNIVPQTPVYRSPEALLGYPHDSSMDMWSLGCLVYELVTGEPLFNFSLTSGDLNQQLVYQMVKFLGLPPKKFAVGGMYSKQYFTKQGKLLKHRSCTIRGSLRHLLKERHSHVFECEQDADLLLDFITSCLRWDPKKRITAVQALQHPWIAPTTNKKQSCQNSRCNVIRRNILSGVLVTLGCQKQPPLEAAMQQ
eukprot:TRINITY_DN906_c0_g1_i1.p1 TRINITY_DN906_c0_g1~~TRINITY_DN906_c0_g1_i1.p1  ORF type:complete len:402 (-),score=19.73 TRINITY_DN906_c0_g1_i1:457-1662(-)